MALSTTITKLNKVNILFFILTITLITCRKNGDIEGKENKDTTVLLEISENGEVFGVWGQSKNGLKCGDWIMRNRSGLIIQTQRFRSCNESILGFDSLSYIYILGNENGEELFSEFVNKGELDSIRFSANDKLISEKDSEFIAYKENVWKPRNLGDGGKIIFFHYCPTKITDFR